MSERDQSHQPEEPVTSIEDDGAINDEQWKAMMDVTMAIYDFREPE
jgi:chromatin structure-remodeling complex subunit RSC1/2